MLESGGRCRGHTVTGKTIMRQLLVGSALTIALAAAGMGAAGAGDAPPRAAVGTPPQTVSMNPRTSFVKIDTATGAVTATANADEERPALSIVKLYLVDYVLDHGDGSADDRALAQRAIQLSDNSAADSLDSKYPDAIDATADAHQLKATSRDGFWGDAYTSADDAARFLADLQRTEPGSPILAWMATAAPVAADGTDQNWGTSHIPGVIGTKWGWSDDQTSEVASASYGNGFTVAAFTDGDADAENADLGSFTG